MDNGAGGGGFSRKRKYSMDDTREDDYSGGIQSEMDKYLSTSNKKHTIDSDEEEDELDADAHNRQKHDVMNEEDIEGQEEETLEFDGETKITPFNMKDELEEGYFDGSGMYIWNRKDSEEVKDSWLDSVDWMKVKQPDANKPKATDPESDEEKSSTDVLVYYRQLLKFLAPKETILKAIKRLGGGNKQLSASERLKQKKLAKKMAESGELPTATPSSSTSNSQGSNESQVNQLTELVNKIMYATGYMDIYDETHESITFKLKEQAI